MRTLFALLAVLLLGAAHPANASVVLRLDGHAWLGWPENNPPLFSFTGRVVVSDAAFAAGSYSLVYHHFSSTDPGLIEQNGVEDFSFDALTFASLIGHDGGVEIRSGSGSPFPSIVLLYNWDHDFEISGMPPSGSMSSDFGLYGCSVGHCEVADATWTIERGPAVPEPASALLLAPAILLLLRSRTRG
jgi:hypothetical protein